MNVRASMRWNAMPEPTANRDIELLVFVPTRMYSE
eukprot:SAG31_NODE_41351_length_276_cov_0.988701_2_plen_34_part_01